MVGVLVMTSKKDYQDPMEYWVEELETQTYSDLKNEDYNQFNQGGNPRIDDLGVEIVGDDDSMLSHESIISTGSSVDGGSDDEYDGTHILDDEFEKYKDQNMERMRSEVEGNVSNFDGMMSQAMTMALMDDDDDLSLSEGLIATDRKYKTDSIQIEADLLWEMNNWLKQREAPSVDDR